MWAVLAMSVGLAAAIAAYTAGRRGEGGRTRLLVSGALVVVACLNGAAPVRGLIDPAYGGYRFGLLEAARGWPVTLMAGTVLALSVAAALIAARGRRGPAMWLAATCLALTVVLGVPWLADTLRDPSSNVVQLGEYLTIPGLAATALILALLVGPLAAGAVWAARRAAGPPHRS